MEAEKGKGAWSGSSPKDVEACQQTVCHYLECSMAVDCQLLMKGYMEKWTEFCLHAMWMEGGPQAFPKPGNKVGMKWE